jgi:hypothetical protein
VMGVSTWVGFAGRTGVEAVLARKGRAGSKVVDIEPHRGPARIKRKAKHLGGSQ